MILFYLVRYVLVEPAVQEGVDTGGAHGGEVDAEEGEEPYESDFPFETINTTITRMKSNYQWMEKILNEGV